MPDKDGNITFGVVGLGMGSNRANVVSTTEGAKLVAEPVEGCEPGVWLCAAAPFDKLRMLRLCLKKACFLKNNAPAYIST